MSRTFAVLALALVAMPVAAQQSAALPRNLQFHGFASQGYIYTDENRFFGKSDEGSFDFRELGVNGSWAPRSDLHLAAQLVSRNAGETDDGDPRVDYGFLDYEIAGSTTYRVGARLGRVVNPFGLYNDTRDVAHTRPSILLPQSIYFDVNRNFALSSDGVQVYSDVSTDYGDWQIQLAGLRPRTDDPDLKPAILAVQPGAGAGDLEGSQSWMLRVLYDRDFGRLRFGLTMADINADYEPAPGEMPIDFNFTAVIYSVQYNAERWSVTGEYAVRGTDLDIAGFQGPDFTGHSYYLQASYRFAPKWEGMLRYDRLVWDDDDPDGVDFQALTGAPAPNRFAKDWTVGVRWDITDDFMLRAELHNINGTGWFSALENTDPAAYSRNWNLFALMASYRF